jgi:class 3 adenylate cyclase
MSCSNCGFDNPEGFRFCGTCGARLDGGDRQPSEVERKVISALFCDVVESTARAERLDPEDVRAVLGPYYDGVRSQLVRYGGTVEKFIGDAVCGLFGAPRTHGDDPERAVRAALAVRDWVAELNESQPGLDLHLRLGVATGEAVVAVAASAAQGEALAWGDVMNTAARLQAAAPIDAVLVDEPTYRATRHVVDYDEADPVQAKGKSEPVLVWQALSPRARRGVDLSQQGSEPFVGRGAEFRLLCQTLDRVGKQRAPELVALVGESGIGKSRLAFELFRWVEQQPAYVIWRQAGSSPFDDVITFWALGEIVKAQAGILETDDAAAAAHKLRRAVGDLLSEPVEASRIESYLRSLVGLEAPELTYGDRRQAAFVAWRRFLEAVTGPHTLVLVFEDVQWADSGLLDFVEHLLDWCRDAAILVVCTARPEFAELRPGWWDRDSVTVAEVPPLSNRHIAELVTALVPEDIPTQTRDAIVGAASGNPLFAVEFARMLADRLEEPPTSESVRGVVAARLDALSLEDKLLLQDAAVVGKAVWPGVLASMDRSRRTVEQRLRELARREFLTRVRPSSVQGEKEFKFRHDLLRDVAYEQISRVRRAEIHRRTAEWLESLSPDRTQDRAEMLALHYVQAFEYAQATGSDTAELAGGARRSLRSAGDRALALNSFAVAERHYQDALDLWADESPERARLVFDLGLATYYANIEGAEVVFAEAEALLLADGDRAAAAEAAAQRALVAHSLRFPRGAVFEHAFRALDLVDGLEPSRSKTVVMLDLANLLSVAAELDRSIELASMARRDAELLGLEELEARALAALGAARGLSGDPDWRADLQRSIEITEAIDSPLVSHHCGIQADLECSYGMLQASFELQARAWKHAERYGRAAHIQWLKAERVSECYWTGRWDEAVGLADAFFEEAEASSGHFMEPYCHAARGRIRLARGDIGAALDDTLEAVEKARLSEEPQMLCPALAARARALVAAGSLGEASQVVDELLALWSDKLNLFLTSAWVVDLAWALDSLGRGSELAKLADGVRARTPWLEAAIACTSGRFDTAATLLAEIGSRPDAALAQLRAVSAGTARDGEARRQLEDTLAFFLEVGATAYLGEAEAVLVG